MAVSLPPIPEESYQEHNKAEYEAGVERMRAVVDAGVAAQERNDEADRDAFAQRARQQIRAAFAPAREAWSRRDFAEQARSRVEEAVAPARRAWQTAARPRAAVAAVPPGTPPGGTGGGTMVDYARQAAAREGIDPEQFVRQIRQESNFDPGARNPSGATGIAQIVPRYHPGVDPTDPYASLDYAARLMAQHKKTYGDDTEALIAYNGGHGAVQAYRAGTPYGESVAYTRAILEAPSMPEPVQTTSAPAGGPTAAGPRPRAEALGQFEQGLPYAEAAAICGPVAALAFAQANGRNPDLGEARRLARQVGWTEQGGMNGVANEQRLLTSLGVSSRLDAEPDFGEIAADAASGNPIIVSTPVHYYYVDGYDEATGRLHVGKTGEARRGGSAWMTPQQIADLDGGLNGALYVDNPRSPQPSVAAVGLPSGTTTQEARSAFLSPETTRTTTPGEMDDRRLYEGTTARLAGTDAGAPYPPAPDEGPYPGSLPPRELEAPVGGSVEPPTRRQRVRDALEGLTDALLGAVDETPEPLAKLTTAQGPAGRMPEEGPYPGSLPTPGADVNAAVRLAPDEEQAPDFPTPDVPFLPFAGAPFMPFQPNKPVRDPEIERKVQAGETLTAGDFVSALTRAAGRQLESTPAALEGIPGLRLGASEEELARGFRRGLTETSGPGGVGRGGGFVSAVGEVTGAGGTTGGGGRTRADLAAFIEAAVARGLPR